MQRNTAVQHAKKCTVTRNVHGSSGALPREPAYLSGFLASSSHDDISNILWWFLFACYKMPVAAKVHEALWVLCWGTVANPSRSAPGCLTGLTHVSHHLLIS